MRQARRGYGNPAGRWRSWIGRAATLVFLALVAWLLYTQLRAIEWQEVTAALRRRPKEDLLLAAALAGASYALYSCFDLLGRHITRHRLSTPRTMTANFISYAFNLNLGALIGGIAFRYRLYSQFGLVPEVITRVLVMSMLTNWLGYLLLAGLAFGLAPLSLPPGWKLDSLGLRLLGFVLLAVVAGYLLLCALARRRFWRVRQYEVNLPSLQLALLQLVMATVNWLLIAAALFMLLERQIDFPTVLSVLLVGAIAGVVTHVPAGLGVLEAVFLALLSHRLPASEMLAALLAYRAIYYVAPLVVAALLYLLVEAHLKSRRS